MNNDNLHEIIRYKDILEHINDAIAITSIDFYGNVSKILYANSRAIEIFGYTKEELLTKYLSDFERASTDEEKIKMMQDKKKIILKNGKYEFEMLSLHKNGRAISLKVKSILIKTSKNEMYLLHFIKDITERKIVENELKQSREEFKVIFENTPIATWYEDYTEVFKYFDKLRKAGIKDLSKYLEEYPDELIKFTKIVKVINLNKAALELYETQTPEELLANFDIKFNNSLYKTFKEGLISIWKGNKHGEFESRIVTFTGREKDVIINYKKLPSVGNNSIKYLITIKDLTEQKKVEKARIKNHSLNALGEMASSVAHDFNNSLQSILGNLELLLYDSKLPKSSLNILETIKKATIDAANRVKIVRRFNKQKENSDYEIINIENLIDDILLQSRPILKDIPDKEGISIEILKKYNNAEAILGNSSELRSVIYNIIKNSVEAMPNGGKIIISSSKNAQNIELIIKDTGIGMTEKVKNKVFQPFYTTKGFELGRGLGMSGVYSIIKEHKGSIDVESFPNKGTSIKILLPISFKNKNYVAPKATSLNKVIKSKKINILWVDDEEMIREVAEKYIKMIKQNGKVAKDGLEALEFLKHDFYDLVITDIGMPNMNGWQLITEIKKLYSNKIKIVVVTGWGSNIPKVPKNNNLYDAVLQKPIEFKDLKEIIDNI